MEPVPYGTGRPCACEGAEPVPYGTGRPLLFLFDQINKVGLYCKVRLYKTTTVSKKYTQPLRTLIKIIIRFFWNIFRIVQRSKDKH